MHVQAAQATSGLFAFSSCLSGALPLRGRHRGESSALIFHFKPLKDDVGVGHLDAASVFSLDYRRHFTLCHPG